MERRLYELVEGSPRLLISREEYRRIMFDFGTEGLYFNPFAHLIQSTFTFSNDDGTYLVVIKVNRGVCTLSVTQDDIEVIYRQSKTFYDFYIVQKEYYTIFGVPLVFNLVECGIISKDKCDEYCSVLFYPPNVTGRTEWDYGEPDDEVNILGVYDREKNPGGWTDVTYNEDGTFTFTPTKIKDIPVDPKNTQAVLLKQKLLKQQQDELHIVK
jgi:hypothetical protein